MPTRRQLIQKITLNSNASSVNFSNIPQNYTDLIINVSSRTNRSNDTGDGLWIRFNGATNNNNLSSRSLEGNGTQARSFTYSSGRCGTISGGLQTSGIFGSNSIYIPNYTSSNPKSYLANSFWENSATLGYIEKIAGQWSVTSNITSISFVPEIGPSFVANSTFYLYGVTHVPIIRGGEVSIAGGYKIHTFRSTSSFQVIEGGQVEYLVIAGGGGGGRAIGGGGGAGGMLNATQSLLPGTPYTITVGAGGAGGVSGSGSNGSNSVFSSFTAIGGGGGGVYNANGANGGSGGGVGGDVVGVGGTGIAGQGNDGGTAGDAARRGGGGGGKGSAGVSGSSTGNGGSGEISSISGITYAAGGGAGAYVGRSAGSGTANVSGNGSSTAYVNGANGTANRGGGGGGGAGQYPEGDSNGGSGGSGIVIIRYPYDGN